MMLVTEISVGDGKLRWGQKCPDVRFENFIFQVLWLFSNEIGTKLLSR